MINVAVYGNSKWSILLKNLLENEYSEKNISDGGDRLCVTALVCENISSDEEITLEEFAARYLEGEFAAIIIPKEYYIKYNDVVLGLLRNGVDVNDIYNGIRLFEKIGEHEEYIPYLITPLIEDSYLSYLEYHVADHCNLNCKYCTHYSPLVKEPVFTDFESFKKDISRLSGIIKDIGVIRILGGEPTLNRELPEFIEYTRKIYPGSIITVVTNGMLLDRIDDRLIKVMNDNKAFFFISYYPPLEEKLGRIKQFLVEKQVAFSVSTAISEFNKTQSLKENENPDFFYSCFQATCTCLHEGKLAPCYAPFTTKYFNDAFGTDIPENEGIDIYDDELSLAELKMRLLLPMRRCAFCIDGDAQKWEIVGKNSSLEDWI